MTPTPPHPSKLRALISSLRRRAGSDSGSVLPLVIVAMPILLLLAAFAIDVANVWAARDQAQKAADAAALAGAQQLTSTTDDVVSAAKTVAQEYVTGTTTQVGATVQTVNANDAGATPSVTAPYSLTTTTPSGTTTTADNVRVDVTKSVPMVFSSLIGLRGATVTASAVADHAQFTEPNPNPVDLAAASADTEAGATNTWYNYCADDNDSTVPTSGNTDPNRCPPPSADETQMTFAHAWLGRTGGEDSSCPAPGPDGTVPDSDPHDGYCILEVAHGGVDVSPPGEGTNGGFMAGHGSGTMIDLTGTCIEAYKNRVSGATTGYCLNNADGEIEERINTVPKGLYTVNFWLNANSGGAPYEKSMMAVASATDLYDLAPIADTAGAQGTQYPLEEQHADDFNALLAHEVFDYYSTVSGTYSDNDPWIEETLTFTATSDVSFIGFASLENCEPDAYSVSALNWGGFDPYHLNALAQTATVTALQLADADDFSITSFTEPPAQVLANPTTAGEGAIRCRFGPAISSDVSVTGPSAVALVR